MIDSLLVRAVAAAKAAPAWYAPSDIDKTYSEEHRQFCYHAAIYALGAEVLSRAGWPSLNNSYEGVNKDKEFAHVCKWVQGVKLRDDGRPVSVLAKKHTKRKSRKARKSKRA